MKSTLLTWALALLATTGVAGSFDGGTQSPFSLGVGARDLSLGGAGLAVTSPTMAPFWNPARLAGAEQFSLAGFHMRLYDSDVAYQYLGVVAPTLDFGTLGLGVFRLGVGGIEVRDAANIQLGETSEERLAFYFSYGRSLAGYDLGATVTLEHQSLDQYKATSSPGLNLSFARSFEPGIQGLPQVTVVVGARNLIRPQMKLAGDRMALPRTGVAGVSVTVHPRKSWQHLMTISAGLVKVDFVDLKISLGAEYRFGQLLQLRGGLLDRRPTFGAGLGTGILDFDYAMIDRELGSLHMFTITTNFGKPVSERKKLRAQRRETEFNQLMSEQLMQRNRDMVGQLAAAGQELLDSGNLAEARNFFDRALFLARSSAMDTSRIAGLAETTERRLQEAISSERFQQFLDSAQVAFASHDYLLTRYFANLALAEKPAAAEAQRLLRSANTAIEQATAHDELIRTQIWHVDSLLTYDRIDQALAIARTLQQLAPTDPTVAAVVNRAQAEHWKQIATAASARQEYGVAQLVIDSALERFPNHRWFTDLRGYIRRAQISSPPVTDSAAPLTYRRLSPELEKTVDAAYQAAQEAFKRGDLQKAVAGWEEVEKLAPGYRSVRKYLVTAYKFVGVELYGQNQLAPAVTVWKKAALLDPDHTEINSYIKRTENEIQRLKELTYEP